MGLQGSLRELTIADLIQHNCQDRKLARLRVMDHDFQALLYFKNGEVIHAEMDDRVGEEVIYHILGWEEGFFVLDMGIEPPKETVHRSWSNLLLEGARRIDESRLKDDKYSTNQTLIPEVKQMTKKIAEILKEMSGDVNGYISSMVAGMDGLNIAQHTTNKADPEVTSAQLTLLIKLVDTSVSKLAAGELSDELLNTERSYVLMRNLPGKQYFLGIIVDRKTSNLGNLRLMSRIYADRISDSIPR